MKEEGLRDPLLDVSQAPNTASIHSAHLLCWEVRPRMWFSEQPIREGVSRHFQMENFFFYLILESDTVSMFILVFKTSLNKLGRASLNNIMSHLVM